MNPEKIAQLFKNRGVTLSNYKDKPCLVVEGFITTYLIDIETHNVYNSLTDGYISIALTNGCHYVDLFSLVLALINDKVTMHYISTLKYLYDKSRKSVEASSH